MISGLRSETPLLRTLPPPLAVLECVLWGSTQPSVESKTLATNTVV